MSAFQGKPNLTIHACEKGKVSRKRPYQRPMPRNVYGNIPGKNRREKRAAMKAHARDALMAKRGDT